MLKHIASIALLPAIWLGYAAVSNVLIASDFKALPASSPPVASLFDGTVTARWDRAYRASLPHRASSIGLVGTLRYWAFHEGRSGVVVGDNGWLYTREEFARPGRPETYLATAAEQIGAVRDQLSAAGVALLVVPLPAKVDIERNGAGVAVAASHMESNYTGLLQALAARSIAAADPRPSMIAENLRQPMFLRTDTHWTPEGAGVVARAVAAAVPSLLGSARYTIREERSVRFRGDLTKFIADGAYASLLGLPLEEVTVRQASSASDAAITDIFGTPEIPVALVGTSYSASENWGFSEDLKVALGMDVLNVSEQGRGPVHPMRAYLASRSFRETPPKLVIWEFPVRYLLNDDLWDGQQATSDRSASSADSPHSRQKL